MTTSTQSLLGQYADIPFADVPGRILLVFLNRSAEQARSDRRYVVQVAVGVGDGKSKQDFIALARRAFAQLRLQKTEDISFLLPRFSSTSTETDVRFDDSVTWYMLLDEMFAHLDERPLVLGVQCSTLSAKPQRAPMDKLINDLVPMLMPMLMVLGMMFAMTGK